MLLTEPAAPAGLYAKVPEGYIDNIQSGAKVGPEQVKLLKDAVEKFSDRVPADALKERPHSNRNMLGMQSYWGQLRSLSADFESDFTAMKNYLRATDA
jgi:hypothetical protein